MKQKNDSLIHVHKIDFAWNIEVYETWKFDKKELLPNALEETAKDKIFQFVIRTESKDMALSMVGYMINFVRKYFVESDNYYTINLYAPYQNTRVYHTRIKGTATEYSHFTFSDTCKMLMEMEKSVNESK